MNFDPLDHVPLRRIPRGVRETVAKYVSEGNRKVLVTDLDSVMNRRAAREHMLHGVPGFRAPGPTEPHHAMMAQFHQNEVRSWYCSSLP